MRLPPAWRDDESELFLTWRLEGSVPEGSAGRYATAGEAFAELDRVLNAAEAGPQWLGNTAIARECVLALKYNEAEMRMFDLVAWVVMPNHLHLLIHTNAPPAVIARTKDRIAKRANQILRRSGQPFWADRAFERTVKTEAERRRIISYIERDPARAGLVEKPEDWPWSSAARQQLHVYASA